MTVPGVDWRATWEHERLEQVQLLMQEGLTEDEAWAEVDRRTLLRDDPA
jgi:hypothetical protein